MTETPSIFRRRVAVILNPVSGQWRGRRRARRLLERLAAAGASASLHPTSGPGDARASAARMASQSDLLISVGGDGTLNEVLNGLLDSGARTPVLVLASGTANMVARELGLPSHPAELAAAGLSGPVRRLDAGLVVPPPRSGEAAAARRFVLCAGAGFDAAVVEEVRRHRKGRGLTELSYLLPLLATMRRYAFPPMRVLVDGDCVAEDAVYTVVSNTRRYAGPFFACPQAVPDDGLLDVCCLPRSSFLRMTCQALAMILRRMHRLPEARYRRGRRIELQSDREVPVQLDGDPAGGLPMRIEVVPSAVALCVPADSLPAPTLRQAGRTVAEGREQAGSGD
jgi:YegS/Rv2252/BmrU family lipid kinase